MNFLLAGASGRMGQAIQSEAVDHAITPLPRNADQLPAAAALIDFTRPERTVVLAALAAQANIPFISGTTGLNDAQFASLQSHSTTIPVLWAANMSIGVNLLLSLVKQAAARLDAAYDIEITDMHHKHKIDAPSGTALALGRAAAEGRRIAFEPVTDRLGTREPGSIGFAVTRGGGIVGEHRVLFASEYERVELAHAAQDRRLFARGALTAAQWLINQPPGWYSMQDMLAPPAGS